jgi:cell division protein FtsN
VATRRKNTRGASRAQARTSGGSGALRSYAAGFGSGLFTALLLYLATLPPEGGDRGDAAPVATAPEQPQPSFDFYEVLPEQTIDVDVDPADLPTERPRSERPAYLLQAGSFRQAEDADRRRAELLLLGLEPRVEETNGSNGRWFRVVIGPFESRSAMARARSLTAQQDIDTLLMQRKRG